MRCRVSVPVRMRGYLFGMSRQSAPLSLRANRVFFLGAVVPLARRRSTQLASFALLRAAPLALRG